MKFLSVAHTGAEEAQGKAGREKQHSRYAVRDAKKVWLHRTILQRLLRRRDDEDNLMESSTGAEELAGKALQNAVNAASVAFTRVEQATTSTELWVQRIDMALKACDMQGGEPKASTATSYKATLSTTVKRTAHPLLTIRQSSSEMTKRLGQLLSQVPRKTLGQLVMSPALLKSNQQKCLRRQ
ncbi:hypothetical protein DQ04_06471070 [Trypanosoma grayi]|uniref:hypothetical protein n=1 Tax=Trypanosoma grayi TaxID=71804 RepID=UPI0004F4893A|nr:hypothetical protein DQ04_06471070 [Trypanosoma grayi]KEG08778.1 hypothetical protein DQ04_06471070 [Trypanosoma grayi]